MAGVSGSRLRIMYIRDYLEENSDENHYITAAELLKFLEEKGIPCDRKTIYADIQSLMDYGLDIINSRGAHGGYRLLSGSFEVPELKLLIDSVQSARFLTQKKCRALIDKLLTLCSKHDQDLVKRQMVVSGRVKNMNESIYVNLDHIQDAIAQNRQITFRYFNWTVDHKRNYRGDTRTASPYGLCLDGGNYYLMAHTPEHGPTNFRIDRMERIEISDIPREKCPELSPRHLAAYAESMFQMFSGKGVQVKLRMANKLTNVVFDRFGQSILLIPDGEGYFNVTVDVADSPQFFGWVLGFGKDCEIVYPYAMREKFKDYCKEVLEVYG